MLAPGSVPELCRGSHPQWFVESDVDDSGFKGCIPGSSPRVCGAVEGAETPAEFTGGRDGSSWEELAGDPGAEEEMLVVGRGDECLRSKDDWVFLFSATG